MPSAYNSTQRQAVNQFVQFTNAKESVAARFLKSSGWNSEAALDAYYQSGQATTSNNAGQQTLSRLFDKYRDDATSYPDRIGVSGISNYLTDITVRPDEVACLALMELLQAPTIGELHRPGFISGWLSGPPPICDNIPRQKSHMSTLRIQIQSDPTTFKRVYRYTFTICRREGQKNVDAEVALEMWRLFFSSPSTNGGIEISGQKSGTPWLDWWIEFYEEKYSTRPVNKDLWNMFGEMAVQILEEENNTKGGGTGHDAGFGWWSEDGAWPGAIDEFVQWVGEKRSGTMDTS